MTTGTTGKTEGTGEELTPGAGRAAEPPIGSETAEGDLHPGDFYMEGPYLVFTAEYHLRRGYCCNSGCRHCPYS